MNIQRQIRMLLARQCQHSKHSQPSILGKRVYTGGILTMKIQRQVRILLTRQRQRSSHRQLSMLSRSAAEVGCYISSSDRLEQNSEAID